MDGLSIATACFAFIEIADRTFKVISDFVRDCKDARTDLAAVNQELLALKRTLNLLRDLVTEGNESDLTGNTKRDIRDIIQNSLGVAETLEDELRGQEGRLLAVNWATRGKRKVATYKLILETNRRALSLAVETITLATAKNIKQDTTEILDETTHMRGDISWIMSRIQNLETLMSGQETDDSHTFLLRRYLDELSSVAGSVCEVSSRSTSPEPMSRCTSPQDSTKVDEDAKSEEASLLGKAPQDPTKEDITPGLQTKSLGRDSEESITDSVVPSTLIPTTPGSSPNDHAFQLRQSQFLPKTLEIEQNTHPTALSSDGNKLIWMQRVPKPDDIYDIESKRASNIMALGPVDRIRSSIYKSETKALTTDASLILFKTSKSCWKVYDRLTNKTIKRDFSNSLATWKQQILPISTDCSLVLLGHYRKGYTINRIRRTVSSRGEEGLVWTYKVLPSSRDSALHHITISRDGQSITGLLGGAQQLLTYSWRLPPDWFTDEPAAIFPSIQPPEMVTLQQEEPKNQGRVLSLRSSKHALVVLKAMSSTRIKHHAGFRNTGFKTTTFDLNSGAILSSHSLSVSDIHVDDSKSSFFTDAKISVDGKLLRTRIARTPDSGKRRVTWTGMETIVIRMRGLEVVHQFQEVWNADFSESLTLSIFAPNYDLVARLAWRKRGEDQASRIWLEVYELKESKGEETTFEA